MASIEDFAGEEEAFVAEWLTQQVNRRFKGMYCHFTLLLFLTGASCTVYKYNFIVSIKLC